MQVAADHDATVAGRNEELKVIATAKKILQDTTSGAVDEAYSFLQLRTGADLAGAEVVTALRKLAKDHNDASLAQLASQVAATMQYGASAGEDPFVKIKGLIKAMIVKLTKTMEAEAEEKAWCDEQMAKTEEKQTELEDDVAKLTSTIDQASAASATLKDEVAELQSELADLAKLQSEMDKIRAEQNAAYLDAKADYELGLKGVRKALGVLRDYYGGAGSSAFLQGGADLASMMKQPAKPELHGKSSGAGGSIIDILEVCESDFAKNLAQEESTEADALAEYEKTTQENKLTQTTKQQDVKYKTIEFVGLDKEIAQWTSDRKSTQSELDAVNEYYDKVKDKCIAKPETYEERKKKRASEIAGLKEALSILENEVAFTQLRKRGSTSSRFLGM
jgi:chromosome segregation ATPase